MSKKIHQYEINGQFLESFDNTTLAANSIGKDESSLRKKLNTQDPVIMNGFLWSRKLNTGIKNNIAKILIFDIETSPMLTANWSLFKSTAGINQIFLDWKMLMWAAKWLGEDEIETSCIRDNINITNPFDLDDFDVTEQLWHLMNEADFLIAHNGRAFDTKSITAKFIEHGLPSPTPYTVIDTLEIAKRHFRFTSNKLDYIAQLLGLGKKLEHEGFELWKKCMYGNKEAWNTMEKYCKQDVVLLEKVYLKLREFDNRHPSISIFNQDNDIACTKCGSKHIHYVKDTYTNTRVYKLYKCNECGSFSRSRSGVNKENVLMCK